MHYGKNHLLNCKEMVEHISSDDTSTIESAFTDTTLIINASKCLFCDKILGYQGKFASDMKYHYSCLEQKMCVFCGCSGLNTLCKQQGCTNVFHIFCLQRYCKKTSIEEFTCGMHFDKRKEKGLDFNFLFKKIANHIQMDNYTLDQYKVLKTEVKPHYLSHGQIFWSIIGTQYFTTNVKLYNLPIFSLKPTIMFKRPLEKNWVSTSIKKIEKELKIVKNTNKNLFKEICPLKLQRKKTEKSKLNEREVLVCEARLQCKKSLKDFLGFMEKNMKPPLLDDDAVICAICLEDDYDDDDLILPCKSCGITVHMQCYGISPEDKEYICSSCTSDSKYKNLCALCPIKGGVLKSTINVASASFPTHHNLPSGTTIWVHLFCALHIDFNCIKDKYKMEQIDLKGVDKKKFLETCEVCKSQNGACIRCYSSRCKTFFHPKCSKNLFLYTRNKTGFDEVGVFCDVHRPSRIRRRIEMKEKRVYFDFINFIKTIEKLEKTKV